MPESLITLNIVFKVNNRQRKKVIEDYNPFCVNALFKQYWEGFKHRNKDILRDIECRSRERCFLAKMKIGGFGHTTVRNVMKTIIFLLDVIAGYALVVGKRYADDWAESLVENTFDVPHKHIVFGLPPVLWNELRSDRESLEGSYGCCYRNNEMVLWLNVQ